MRCINVTVPLYQNMATCQLNLFHNMYVSVLIHSHQMIEALCAVCIFTLCRIGVVEFPGDFTKISQLSSKHMLDELLHQDLHLIKHELFLYSYVI